MSTVTASAKESNWFRLQHVAGHSCICLRRLFKSRYQQFYNLAWNDTTTCGAQFFNKVVSPNQQHFKLFSSQKTYIQNGNSDEWDVSLLIALLLNIVSNRSLTQSERQVLKKQNQFLKDLRDIRNELAHHGTRQISDSDFNTSWLKLKNILVFFGEDDVELEKMRDDIEFKSVKEEEDAESTKEMERLKALGNQSFDGKNFTDAIKYYAKALTLPSLLSKNRAVLYSNLSRTRLTLYEQIQDNTATPTLVRCVEDERYHALRDAKEARKLWPTWWKAHYRVGNAYSSMNEQEKSINSFERALALDPSSVETKKALDSSKSTYSQQQRHEHLDPRMKQQTMDEHLNEMNEKYDIDPEQIRLGHLLREMSGDAAETDVINGHKYFNGDVKYGIKQDYDRAAKYYAAAARQGNAEGMYNLGMMYDRGQGVEKDHALATHFYQSAASQPPQLLKTNRPNIGVAEAEHSLGLRYYNGIDVSKNLAMAACWYKRSARHGCEHAANNLGIMYLEGAGVTQDKQKAEHWLQFAAIKGDINAMCTLAQLLLEDDNFLMARLWFKRACDAGNTIAQMRRDNFERMISQKEAFVKGCPLNLAQIMKQMERYLSDTWNRKPTPSKQIRSNYNYHNLKEYAAKGSATAKALCLALEHFYTALSMIIQSGNINENKCLNELAEAYRIEYLVVQYSSLELYDKFQLLIDESFKNQPDNEDAQICYVYFHGENFKHCIEILNQLKSKNPKSVPLLVISADINCFLKRWNAALLDCNTGLKLDSKNYELHYIKAVALRCMENPDKNDILEAYRIFLKNAPTDHRKAPEAYYAMAKLSLPTEESTATGPHTCKIIPDEVLNIYNLGLEAEQVQLPCYLPCKSPTKPYFDLFFNMVNLSNGDSIETDQTTATVRHNPHHLLNPRRVELFREHRSILSTIQNILGSNSPNIRITTTNLPDQPQKKPKKLTNLKSICLKEIDPTKNHIYEGHVLSVTLIEQTVMFTPSILLLVEDDNLDVERLFIYGFNEEEGQRLITEVFVIGSKMNILNPSLKIGTTDLKPGIRVDDFSSIIMQDESEKVLQMCRCCGEANSMYRCSRCKQAYYCRSDCQKIDWKKYKHRLLCKTA